MTDRLDTDHMQLQMIAMSFPRGDIALFLEAVNFPKIRPHNARQDRQEPVVNLAPRNTELSLREALLDDMIFEALDELTADDPSAQA